MPRETAMTCDQIIQNSSKWHLNSADINNYYKFYHSGKFNLFDYKVKIACAHKMVYPHVLIYRMGEKYLSRFGE